MQAHRVGRWARPLGHGSCCRAADATSAIAEGVLARIGRSNAPWRARRPAGRRAPRPQRRQPDGRCTAALRRCHDRTNDRDNAMAAALLLDRHRVPALLAPHVGWPSRRVHTAHTTPGTFPKPASLALPGLQPARPPLGSARQPPCSAARHDQRQPGQCRGCWLRPAGRRRLREPERRGECRSGASLALWAPGPCSGRRDDAVGPPHCAPGTPSQPPPLPPARRRSRLPAQPSSRVAAPCARCRSSFCKTTGWARRSE